MSRNVTVECYGMVMVKCYEVEMFNVANKGLDDMVLCTNHSSFFPLPLSHTSLLSVL